VGTVRARRLGSSVQHRTQWAATYEGTEYDELPWFSPDPTPELVSAVEDRFFAPGSPVLDIGCGAGSNVLYLARQGFESHGIDLAPAAIRTAQDRAGAAGLTVDVQVGDALALAFPRSRFAGIVDHGCFHTLPIPRRPDYVAEVARVLRPGGAFLLSWVAREHTGPRGPPHRPSLAEVAAAFEAKFLFERTSYVDGGEEVGLPAYHARLRRRANPQPARR
jgi:SAM-dependent methyltransferase